METHLVYLFLWKWSSNWNKFSDRVAVRDHTWNPHHLCKLETDFSLKTVRVLIQLQKTKDHFRYKMYTVKTCTDSTQNARIISCSKISSQGLKSQTDFMLMMLDVGMMRSFKNRVYFSGSSSLGLDFWKSSVLINAHQGES